MKDPGSATMNDPQEQRLPSVGREDCIFMVGVCEKMHKYDAMISYMKMALEHDPELYGEEKRLLVIAYKLALTGPRNSYKVATLLEQKEEAKQSENYQVVKDHRLRIEKKMKTYIFDFIQLLENVVIPPIAEKEDCTYKILYLKTKADYYRYACEFATGEVHSKMTDSALEAYTEARELCDFMCFSATDAQRIRVILNFSQFHYEILQNQEKGLQIAKQLYYEIVENLDSCSNYLVVEIAELLKQLRENLVNWTNELGDENAEEG